MIFPCECGDHHFLKVSRWEGLVSLIFIDRPPTFWEKIQALFTHYDIASEIILSENQVRELVRLLDEALADN